MVCGVYNELRPAEPGVRNFVYASEMHALNSKSDARHYYALGVTRALIRATLFAESVVVARESA